MNMSASVHKNYRVPMEGYYPSISQPGVGNSSLQRDCLTRRQAMDIAALAWHGMARVNTGAPIRRDIICLNSKKGISFSLSQAVLK